MKIKTENHAIALSPAENAALLALAAKHGTVSRSGKTTGQPSWRALMSRLADGTLAVCQPKRQPKKITQ